MKEQYEINKAAKIGDELKCPTCGTAFVKPRKRGGAMKVFCTSSCKDKFHSTARNHKPERYYPITVNSCVRFLLFDGEVMTKNWWEAFLIGTLKHPIVSNPSISYRVENVRIDTDDNGELVFILKVEE